jgi:hypothetical protein
MTNLLAHAKPPVQQHQERSEEEEISDLHFPPKREIFFLQILYIGRCDRKPWRRRLSETKRRRRRPRETWDAYRKEQNALQDDQRRARRSCQAEQLPPLLDYSKKVFFGLWSQLYFWLRFEPKLRNSIG